MEHVIRAASSFDDHRTAGLIKGPEGVPAAVWQLPQAVAILAHLAEWAADNAVSPSGATARGRRASLGLDALFRDLAGIFYATFGVPPSTGSDRSDAAQGSLLWVCEVLKLANSRVAGSILLDYAGNDRLQLIEENAFTQLIRSAQDLAPATKADRLADGLHEWNKLTDAVRWPTHIWSPGRRDPNDSVVPKWLRSRPILTPRDSPDPS